MSLITSRWLPFFFDVLNSTRGELSSETAETVKKKNESSVLGNECSIGREFRSERIP